MNNLKCPECGHGTFEEITQGKNGTVTMVFKMRCATCHNNLEATVTAMLSCEYTWAVAEQGDLHVQSRRKA